MAGLRLHVVVVAGFLQKKVRPRTHECVGRRFTLNDRLHTAIPGIEAAEQIEGLTWLGDGMPNVEEIVSEALELGAVLGDAQITLLEAAEFGLEEDRVLEFIIAEESLNVTPQGERRGARFVDNVENRLLDGG